jgi:hypothetical protein
MEVAMNDSRTQSRAPTDKQRETLSMIRDGRTVVWKFDKGTGGSQRQPVYTEMIAANGRRPMVLTKVRPSMITRLEERGLITLDHSLGDDRATQLRITNAGRVALGDWAAGEES